MRDPDRIQKFTNRLANVWRCYPDLRFGQLISNFILAKFATNENQRDPFFVEDDEMIELIEDYLYRKQD